MVSPLFIGDLTILRWGGWPSHLIYDAYAPNTSSSRVFYDDPVITTMPKYLANTLTTWSFGTPSSVKCATILAGW